MRKLIALLFTVLQLQAATYYVRKGGNDACNGTSPALGSSGACAWLTIGHALTAGALTNADKVWVGGGTYRESGIANAYNGYTMQGDVTGANTGDAGYPVWTAYTTNDTSAPAATTLLSWGAHNGIVLDSFVMIGGNAGPGAINYGFQASISNITVKRCIITMADGNANNNLIIGSFLSGTLGFTFDSNIFISTTNQPLAWNFYKAAAADYNANIVYKNNLFTGQAANYVVINGLVNGGNAFLGGGVTFINNTWTGVGITNGVTTASSSTTFPVVFTNNYFDQHIRVFPVLSAGAAGQITEDYNAFDAIVTTNTNVTAGTHSILAPNFSAGLNFGLSWTFPLLYRCTPLWAPMAGSPLLGAGNTTGAPTTDITGAARPNPPSIGAFELKGPSCPALFH